MTNVVCSRNSCVYQNIAGYCIKEEIELEHDAEEYGLMECKQYVED